MGREGRKGNGKGGEEGEKEGRRGKGRKWKREGGRGKCGFKRLREGRLLRNFDVSAFECHEGNIKSWVKLVS